MNSVDMWLCYSDGRSLVLVVIAESLCPLFLTVNTTGNVARLGCCGRQPAIMLVAIGNI